MKADRPDLILAELARRLSVKKLLDDFPSLTRDRVREILEKAARSVQDDQPSHDDETRPKNDTWIINVDGASRGNPGPAGAGARLQYGDEYIELKKFLGRKTNNVAEYEALIMALEEAISQSAKNIEVRSDSELLVRQMNGQYRVKSPHLVPLFRKAYALASNIEEVKIIHVGRDENREADRLANLAIDGEDDH